MKIGIISDIHADLAGLETALEILYQQSVNQIICAGDLVGRGPNPDRVVELIKAESIPCVLGNHDEAAIDRIDLVQTESPSASFSNMTLNYLRELPFALRFEWERFRVLLTHGTPQDNYEYLYPHSPAAKFKVIARESRADIIIFGHTHEPTKVRSMGVWFFNPGSVYDEKMRGSRTCATLSLPDCSLTLFDLLTGSTVQLPYSR